MSDQSRSTQREIWIDAAKGGAILLVVIHHAFYLLGRMGAPSALHGKVDTLLEPPVMATFFLASAILTAARLHLSPRRFFGRKLLPLVWFFAVWSMLLGALNGWSPTAPLLAPDGLIGFVAEAVLRPQNGMWFVWLLIVYTGLAWLLRGLRPVTLISLSAALAALWGAGAMPFGPGPFSWLVVSNAFQFAPAFFVGIALPGLFVAAAARPRRALLLLGLSVAAFAAITAIDLARAGHMTGATAAWRGMAGGPMGVAAAILVARWRPLGRPLAWLGQRSFSIFVGHGVVLLPLAMTVIPAVAPVLRRTGEAGILVAAALMAAVGIAGALVLVWGLMRLRLVWLYAPPVDMVRDALRRLGPGRAPLG